MPLFEKVSAQYRDAAKQSMGRAQQKNNKTNYKGRLHDSQTKNKACMDINELLLFGQTKTFHSKVLRANYNY